VVLCSLANPVSETVVRIAFALLSLSPRLLFSVLCSSSPSPFERSLSRLTFPTICSSCDEPLGVATDSAVSLQNFRRGRTDFTGLAQTCTGDIMHSDDTQIPPSKAGVERFPLHALLALSSSDDLEGIVAKLLFTPEGRSGGTFRARQHSEPVSGWHSCAVACEALEAI
jgi:hypothetical protein